MNIPPPESFPSELQPDTPMNAARGLRRRPFWVFSLVVLAVFIGAGSWMLAQGPQGSPFPGPQPAFGTLTASPPNFVLDTPTTVTFTIAIESPTVNPTTVALQRVDADGVLIAPLGRMFDNGQSGDARPGDRIFTAQVRFNESEIGRRYIRVAAAFRGNQQNAQSAQAFVDVDPFLLPPDPGEAGKETLPGIDSDEDGVRDDVQRWISLQYFATPPLIAALEQFSRTNQAFISNADNSQDTVIQIAQQRLRAQACLNYEMLVLLKDARESTRAVYRTIREFKTILLNTNERTRAFFAADAKLSGVSFPPDRSIEWKDGCLSVD